MKEDITEFIIKVSQTNHFILIANGNASAHGNCEEKNMKKMILCLRQSRSHMKFLTIERKIKISATMFDKICAMYSKKKVIKFIETRTIHKQLVMK